MKSIVLLVLCCMVGILGNAKSKVNIEVSDAFLTYAQFQALTPTERISYIKDVRQLFYDLTKENDFFAGSPKSKAFYAMIDLFQAEAFAQSSGSVAVTNPDGSEVSPEGQAGVAPSSGQTGVPAAASDPTRIREEGWFLWRTQDPPAPVEKGEWKKVSPQPSVTEPAKPSGSAAPTEQSDGGGGGGSQSTTAISPEQALANKWAAEDMDPKKPCPGGQVGSLVRTYQQRPRESD